MPETSPDIIIGIVGPCGSGKSTLAGLLSKRHLHAKAIAQEHSFVPDMWQRITHPDVLVFLDASFPIAGARRRLSWSESDYTEQHRRLSHARSHADLYIFTDEISPEEVARQVLDFLQFQV